MRDPVKRSMSDYWWNVQWSAEGRDMLTVMKKVPDIKDISYYAMQLRPYIDIFGRDRVMTLTLEELSAAPTETLQQIFKWLGVDSSFIPPDMSRRYNISPEKVPTVRGARFISLLRGTFVWEVIKGIMSSQLRQRVIKLLSRPVERDLRYVEATVDYLRPIQQEQTQELCELLGRDFSEWKTLYGT